MDNKICTDNFLCPYPPPHLEHFCLKVRIPERGHKRNERACPCASSALLHAQEAPHILCIWSCLWLKY